MGDNMVKGIMNKNILNAYKQKWIESGEISWLKGLWTKNIRYLQTEMNRAGRGSRDLIVKRIVKNKYLCLQTKMNREGGYKD